MSFSSGLKVASLGGRLAVVDAAGQEEVDTKIVSHIQDALRCGYYSQHTISLYTDADIWVGFGSKTYQYYHIHTIYDDWGSRKCTAVSFCHALTSGSDTTSQFLRHGQKTAWNTWDTYQEATEAFVIPADNPCVLVDESSEVFQYVEIFVCLLYKPSID